MKYKPLTLIACGVILIASLVSNGILIFNLMKVKKTKTSLKEEKELLEKQSLDYKDTSEAQAPQSEHEQVAEEDENIIENPQTYTIKYKSTSTIAEEVFNIMAEDVPYPLMYIEESTINKSPTYSYADYGKKDIFVDYDFFRIEATLVTKNNVSIFTRQGWLSLGGRCHDDYDITTSQGTANVCKYNDLFTVWLQKDLPLENKYRDELDYVFYLEGDYEKDDIEELFANIKITS